VNFDNNLDLYCLSIAEIISKKANDSGIICDKCPLGEILFLLEMYQHTNTKSYFEIFVALLSNVIDSNKNESYYLLSSYTALNYCLSSYEEYNKSSAKSKILELSKKEIDLRIQSRSNNEHDYLTGSIGLLYLLSRKDQEDFDQNAYSALFDIIVPEVMIDPTLVRTPIQYLENKDWISIANRLAHGNAGYISVLAQLCNLDSVLIPKYLELVNSYLKQTTSPGHQDYGYIVEERKSARTGWCYGNVSAAIAIMHASRTTNSLELNTNSANLFYSSIKNLEHTDEKLDPYLCHGYAGLLLAHEFFVNASICVKSVDAKPYLIRSLLAACTVELDNNNVPRTDLLSGISGVGLYLLSQVKPHPGKWRTLLFL